MSEHKENEASKRPADDDCEEEGDTEMPAKRPRGNGQKIEFRVLLQSKNAGAIIGKGGTNIKRLRTEYKSSVTVPDSHGPERILTIVADVDTVCDMMLDIIPVLEDYQHFRDLNFDCEIRMLVHQSQAGCIIGRAGFKIKELREQTGANIKVYGQVCPNSAERVVQISGQPKIVIDCIQQIYQLLEQSPPKGQNNPYDPRNFDEYYALDYGGFTMEEKTGRGRDRGRGMRGGGGGGGGQGMRSFSNMGDMRSKSRQGGMDRGFGRGGMMRLGNRDMGRESRGMNRASRGFGSLNSGRFGGSGDGMSSGFDSLSSGGIGMGSNSLMGSSGFGLSSQNFSQDNNYGGQMFSGNQNTTTTQVTIPKDLAGSIIGKGGMRIRKIREESEASIIIDEALPGSNDRIIVISGTSNQIQMAQYLLQQSVREYSGKF